MYRIILFSIVFTSCSVFSPNTAVDITVQEVPYVWKGLEQHLSYSLFVYSPDGQVQEFCLSPGEVIRYEAQKNYNTAFLAYPEYQGLPLRFRPAGSVWPDGLTEDGGLVLTWDQGSLAAVVAKTQRLCRETVNTGRLSSEIAERCMENPWAFDIDRTCRALSESGFSARLLDPIDPVDVEMSLPAGSWIFTNPFLPILNARGEPEMYSFISGYYQAVSIDTSAYLSFLIDEEGAVEVLRLDVNNL
ncbi:MAG: hypothetical protein ACLFR1_02275 [Spirochaetia bacterium]